jgi:hypothetical protein
VNRNSLRVLWTTAFIVAVPIFRMTSHAADSSDACDNTWSCIKEVTSTAKDVTDYYSAAKTAIEIGELLGTVLGLIGDSKTLRFFADRAAKKWRLRGSLKYAGVLLAYPP